MISNFDNEAQEILNNAKIEMQELKHPYIGTEHLLLSILKCNNELTKKLENLELTYQKFKNKIINTIGIGSKKSNIFLYTPLIKKAITNAIMDSKENNNGTVTSNHLFSGIIEVGEGIAIRTLISMNIDLDTIYDELTEKIYKQKNNHSNLLEKLGTNLTSKAKNKELEPLFGREKEINEIEEILCRKNKNNPLLLGEPGVGKTAIVEGLANLIISSKVPYKLQNKKIISVDMATMVAGTKYRGEFEEKMKKIIREIENDESIILFIDEIHTLIGAGGAEGAIDASNILKPALARGKIKCIGATTYEEYRKHFEKDKALERRFQIIKINEPTIEETKQILYKLKPIYENYHNVKINKITLDNLVTLTNKYIYDKHRPDKEIDILDTVCSKINIKNNQQIIERNMNLKKINNIKNNFLKNKDIKKAYKYKIQEEIINQNNYQKKPYITIKDVAKVISNKTNIPIYEINKTDKKSLENLETTLKNNIIGQNYAIDKILKITKRIKYGYKSNKCTSLLFIGPNNVGKTKLATLYGKLLTQKEVIKINMPEYNDYENFNKLLGTYESNENNYIMKKIKDNPNAVIIFNEFEKAKSRIINLLCQILKEGKTKDAKNNIINFANNIIIVIANDNLNSNIGFTSINKEKIDNNLINKFNHIIKFNNLKKEDLKKIIQINLQNLTKKYNQIRITYNEKLIEKILEKINYQKFGAQEIKYIIENNIENTIIDNIINNQKEININSILT